MKPTKQAKPVKAWGLLSKRGVLFSTAYATRGAAEFECDFLDVGAEPVRVEIRVIGGKK